MLSFFRKYKNKYWYVYDVSGFSFYGNKTITTGEGGLATCSKIKYYKKFKMLKNYGRLEKEFINMKP